MGLICKNLSTLNFQIKPLFRSTDNDSYKLYRAAHEWDLDDPIIIKNKEDIKSESKWKDLVNPFHHQVKNLITFCRRLPVTLLSDDVGLGKTISAGLIASELISRGRVTKVLIICPKILMNQWKEELILKFGIKAVTVTGSKLIKKKLSEEIEAVITTYQSARLYLDQISNQGYEMLILDEAHKLRNLYGIEKPPQVAIKFRHALAERAFKYVLMLTATPIHNRLWDLYSLIDLLTVARGHQNPFGSEGMFARNFIEDDREKARKLRPEKIEEFRSIIYGYMSRVRRSDINLNFPEREILLHKVEPTIEELKLLEVITDSLKDLNKLTQISILQAFTSSPQALASQLKNMAKKKTIPQSLSDDIQNIVKDINSTSKLNGLEILVNQLQKERPNDWRLVIFTTRRETQTSIQTFLESKGINCGIINGTTTSRNPETILKFKNDSPEINVIISTEAGSEGVNLQAANVLINYDLPWNPMIVEQRIGRIQRLGSNHAKVSIFNIILKNTFEEYIIGRLMEKLLMAANAIGDIESLLQASGVEGNDEDEINFEDQILKLVLASLSGKNVEDEVIKKNKSFEEARKELAKEKKNIDIMLGDGKDIIDLEPISPDLPQTTKSIDFANFILSFFHKLGFKVKDQGSNLYLLDNGEKKEFFTFDGKSLDGKERITAYIPGSTAFEKVLSKLTTNSLHQLVDKDENLNDVEICEGLSRKWLSSFGGIYKSINLKSINIRFEGGALMRVRATVAHDSYERLLEVRCSSTDHKKNIELDKININLDLIEDPESIGINKNILIEKAYLDKGIAEFCRFYNERKISEVKAAGDDSMKQKKLEDEFTPRLNISLVGLQGHIFREYEAEVSYSIQGENIYRSIITIIPNEGKLINSNIMGKCNRTNYIVPIACLERCSITNLDVLKNFLITSEISGRKSQIEKSVVCSLSNKRVLIDEIEISSVTGQPVIKSYLRTSDKSGKKAEPQFFSSCEFTGAQLLQNELSISQISGKRFRIDEQASSSISGKIGHIKEFIRCPITNRIILPTESEKCEVTGTPVMPGILETCEITNKKVLPTELGKSAYSGKKVINKYLVKSSISSSNLIENEALKSITGKYCSPLEARVCQWSGRLVHPEDLKICYLTGLHIYLQYLVDDGHICLENLINLLHGLSHSIEKSELWNTICMNLPQNMTNIKIIGSKLSPDGTKLAISAETKSLLGLKTSILGFVYSLSSNEILGRVSVGRRQKGWWKES